MVNLIPPDYQYLLNDETKAFCWVATVMPSGGPQLTCVCSTPTVNTSCSTLRIDRRSIVTSKKIRKFAIAIVDPNNPQKYMQIRGKVEFTEEGAEGHTNVLSRKYTGEDFTLIPGYKRVMFKVTPIRITLWPPKR